MLAVPDPNLPMKSTSPSDSSSLSPTSPTSSLPHYAESSSRPHPGKPGKARANPTANSRGKSGCWTCRLRQKRCDEIKENNCCQTCRRLDLECLGWGAKRPDWMKDKEQVAAKKAEIKQKLADRGLVRGLPRTPAPVSVKSMPPMNVPITMPTLPRLPSPPRRVMPYTPLASMLGTTLPTSDVRRESLEVYDRGYHHPVPRPPPPVIQSDGLSVSGLASPTHIVPSHPAAPFQHTQASACDWPVSASTITTTPTASTGTTATVEDEDSVSTAAVLSTAVIPASPTIFYDNMFFDMASLSRSLLPSSPFSHHQDKHVQYYFSLVLPMQYLFAPKRVGQEMKSLILRTPSGVVTNAISTLAALHDGLMRKVLDNNALRDQSTEGTIVKFLDQVFQQVVQAQQEAGGLVPLEVAVAALHLVSYSLFNGGRNEWQVPLGLAGDWFEQTGVIQNPAVLLEMDVVAAFCAKTVMWMDIFASIAQVERPRFLSVYRVLFQGGISSKMMATTNGASNKVMLALAETADLAVWKEEQKNAGCLSVRELVTRGAPIEEALHQPDRDSAAERVMSSTIPIFEAGGPLPDAEGSIMSDATRRELAGKIFEHAALLYLHTVLSECKPNVPEIQMSVQAILELLEQLPPSDVDRSLVFPICLAGCLTDVPNQREVFRRRLADKGSPVGNVGTAEYLMQAVWRRRDLEGGVAVSWQEVMKEQGYVLLLV